jgi:hypothetical protein
VKLIYLRFNLTWPLAELGIRNVTKHERASHREGSDEQSSSLLVYSVPSLGSLLIITIIVVISIIQNIKTTI